MYENDFDFYGCDQYNEIEEQARQDEIYKRNLRRQLKQQQYEEEGFDYEE